MKALTPDTILKRVAGIEIDLDYGTHVCIALNGQRQLYSERSLAVLDVFARSISLREALSRLRSAGIQDWIELTDTISKLHRAGILAEASAKRLAPDAKTESFGALPIHIWMLNDRGRTESFLQAISEVVKPGDVVVDIGTGTGILAVAAARAGASRVYAIEATAIGDAAQAVFACSNVANQITLIRGWSTQVELPQRADVLVSEIIGSDPFAEGVLSATLDARRRLLKPDARFVPRTIRAYGLAVTIPPEREATAVFTDAAIENWRQWYNVDFSALKEIDSNSASPVLYLGKGKASEWPILSGPALLSEVDLSFFQETIINRNVTVEITQAGVVNGLLLFFELEIGSNVINSHPKRGPLENQWPNPVWCFQDGCSVKPGDRLNVEYNFNARGNNSELRLLK